VTAPSYNPARGFRARSGVLRLPAEGRTGPPPPWPLASSTAAERRRWAHVWSSPQAVAWERLRIEELVARYVRLVLRCEKRDASAFLQQQAIALEDRLGLSPRSMRLLLWDITEDEVANRWTNAAERTGRVRDRIQATEPPPSGPRSSA
jgi:hypothetical protein